MNLSEFCKQTHLTAVYPGSGTAAGCEYVSLGLIGEVGEVSEHFKKMMRDDNGKLTSERKAKLSKEIGDVMWYWSEARRNLDIPLASISAIPHRRLVGSAPDMVRTLSLYVAYFAVSQPRKDGQLVLSNILGVVRQLCKELDFSLEQILGENVAKLTKRLESGTISGSGSDR